MAIIERMIGTIIPNIFLIKFMGLPVKVLPHRE
jgi:hypothetical protein